MVINRIIREIADNSNLSVADISKLTGYSINRINDIINNHSSVTPSEAFSICDSLGVNLTNLLSG